MWSRQKAGALLQSLELPLRCRTGRTTTASSMKAARQSENPSHAHPMNCRPVAVRVRHGSGHGGTGHDGDRRRVEASCSTRARQAWAQASRRQSWASKALLVALSERTKVTLWRVRVGRLRAPSESPLGQRLHALLWNRNAVAGSALEVLQSYFARLAAGCAAKPLEIRCHHFAFSPAARAHPSHHHQLFLLHRQYCSRTHRTAKDSTHGDPTRCRAPRSFASD